MIHSRRKQENSGRSKEKTNVKTRLNLINLTKIMSSKEKLNHNVIELFQTKDLVKICAPMVRYSKIQFRNLVQNYDCDLCFTPMILADSFHKSEKARRNEFMTNLYDTPVIIQFAANTVDDFVTAATLASPFCSGVDLNCGCPQTWARQQGIGSIMLDNPEKIFEITRCCRNRIQKPFTVSVKTRILNDTDKTVDICRQIEKAGASFLTVHARTSRQSSGEINRDVLKLIKENLNIPIVANGGVKSLTECYDLKHDVGCDGVMVANGILQNPAIFSGALKTPIECVQHWVDICFNSTLSLQKYQSLLDQDVMTIPEKPLNLTFQCFHHHLVFMLEKVLPRRQKRVFNNFKKFAEVLNFLNNEFDVSPKLFSAEKFLETSPLFLNYEGYPNDFELSHNEKTVYNSSISTGKYFQSKIDELEKEDCCNWSDIFIENG